LFGGRFVTQTTNASRKKKGIMEKITMDRRIEKGPIPRSLKLLI
tara:strand:- start:78357 stop:78488 length:132 start_codon:yes stop_codon:yes gene_type:complete